MSHMKRTTPSAFGLLGSLLAPSLFEGQAGRYYQHTNSESVLPRKARSKRNRKRKGQKLARRKNRKI